MQTSALLCEAQNMTEKLEEMLLSNKSCYKFSKADSLNSAFAWCCKVIPYVVCQHMAMKCSKFSCFVSLRSFKK